MKRALALTPADRDFFHRFVNFVFSNPFSEQRAQLLDTLVPSMSTAALQKDRHALSAVVARRLEAFDRDQPSRLTDFSGEDRQLVEAAHLYLTYHRFLDDLDRLLERQLESDTSVELWFAKDVYACMGQRGFSDDAIARYLSFFYQLRRAFHFIDRSLPGDSPSMRRLRLSLWDNTFTHDMHNFNQCLWNRMEDFSTLLIGETGTGKGSAAMAIGRSSYIPYAPARRCFAENFTKTFIAINLSQFPETLIESELFGHRKGAFTGAIQDHKGVFERCSAHGALFLDEIGEVSAPVQIKLLQVLQERTFSSLGSHAPNRFKGRVIGATNRSLAELRAAGRFRDDLFYRLCSDVIIVPPLRIRLQERPGELEQLVSILVERMLGEPSPTLTDQAVSALERDLPKPYTWPGNVRELEQAVRQILLTGRFHASPGKHVSTPDDDFLAAVQAGTLNADELVSRYCALLHRRYPTYVDVAKRTGLDRRTVRKHLSPLGS